MTPSDRDDLSKKLSAWTIVLTHDPHFQRAVWRRIAARHAGDETLEASLEQISTTLGQLPLES